MNRQTNKMKKGRYRLPIDKLYPNLSKKEQAEAEYFLSAYLEFVYDSYLERQGIDEF